jgi:hypothetical protein
MATRSNINALMSDGTIKSIYVHFDGHRHLFTLQKFYDTQEKVEALIALGDLSSLAPLVDCPTGHTFDHPTKGYCVAYGRDRGEFNTEAKTISSFIEGKNVDIEIEYVYEWDGKTWGVYPPITSKDNVNMKDIVYEVEQLKRLIKKHTWVNDTNEKIIIEDPMSIIQLRTTLEMIIELTKL